MANSFFNPDHAIESQIRDFSIIPLNMGRFLISSDTRSIFYDLQDRRIQLTDILTLDTEAEREAILAPISKFYFVKESGKLWRYNNGDWLDMTGRSNSFTKSFVAGDWSGGTITIPATEHNLSIENSCVGSNVFALVSGSYTSQAFAAMDTDVSVGADKSVVLSYSGTGYAGKVILYG